jgi:hypothetical protein
MSDADRLTPANPKDVCRRARDMMMDTDLGSANA